MNKKKSNLVEIAKILKELREERELHDVPVAIMSKYPEGSQGIVIKEDKYIVLNTKEGNIVSTSDHFNTIKDSSLKYNPNFFLSTHESDEPDIIDETHNKSKLIDEAYTEVSFLPKDIYSLAEFNPSEGKKALQNIIDRNDLSPRDFDDYRVEKPIYSEANVFDEIYRCHCIFNDITGNESVESILIKAFKVSNIKGEEYSYNFISSENIKQYIENLEQMVSNDGSGELRAVYSKISAAEYNHIENNIKEGIEKYYQQNSKKYYRLTRVDIKAIYCLRLRKIPIELNLLLDNSIVAKLNTYYSMVNLDLNAFTCPHCNTLSSDSSHYNGLKIHVDHDFTDLEENMLGKKMPIGCTECMERCPRCGSWHFKLSDYSKVISKGYHPIDSRRFLKNFSKKSTKPEYYCSCKEHLTWIYDEMSYVNNNGKIYYENIIDKFLTESCRATFINYSTGELIASHNDYVAFLNKYLIFYLSDIKDIFSKFADQKIKSSTEEDIRHNLYAFVDRYIVNIDNEFEGFKLESYIKQSILDFKKGLADALNVPVAFIKVTTTNKSLECNCCQASYYAEANNDGMYYYNSVKNLCHCCDEALGNNLTMWTRYDDGVLFYKPKNKNLAIRTFKSNQGEELFDDWLKRVREQLNEKMSKSIIKQEGEEK